MISSGSRNASSSDLARVLHRQVPAIDRVGVHGPRIVAVGKINLKRYEILEVGVVKRVGQSTAFG
jgi:hypothetical protein